MSRRCARWRLGAATTHLFQPRDTYRIATSAEENDQPYVGGTAASAIRAICIPARGSSGISSARSRPTAPSSTYPPPIRQPYTSTFSWGRRRCGARPGRPRPRARPEPSRLGSACAARERDQNGAPAPKAVPARYTVRLSGAGAEQIASLNVLGDPRSGVTTADYQQQFDL